MSVVGHHAPPYDVPTGRHAAQYGPPHLRTRAHRLPDPHRPPGACKTEAEPSGHHVHGLGEHQHHRTWSTREALAVPRTGHHQLGMAERRSGPHDDRDGEHETGEDETRPSGPSSSGWRASAHGTTVHAGAARRTRYAAHPRSADSTMTS